MEAHSAITPDYIKFKLTSKDGQKGLLQARGDEARQIVNVLDEILIEPNLHNKQRIKYSAALRKLCGACCLLPDSHIILDGLEVTSPEPVAYGGFADVFQGSYKGRPVAIKTLRIPAVKEQELARLKKPLFKEAAGWKHLDHPNVLPFLGAWIKLSSVSLISPWMDNGEINEYVKSHPLANRLELLADVAEGVEYLHSVEVVHGDLKGANILISAEHRALLADFGLMNVVSDPGVSRTDTSALAGGTTRWMSPELLSPEHFDLSRVHPTRESDVYALGMVILEVLTGAQPFTEMKRNQNVTIHVVNGKRPSRPVNSESLGISDPLWATLWSCWIADPTRRPGVEAVRKLLQQEIPTWDLRPSIQAPSQPDLDVQSETSTSSFRGTTRSRSVDERSVSSARSDSGTMKVVRQVMARTVDIGSLVIVRTTVSKTLRGQNGANGTQITRRRSSSATFLKKYQLLYQTAWDPDRIRNIKDLNKQIDIHHVLLELCPPGDSSRPLVLYNLGRYLRRRFDQIGDVEDLERAIQLHREYLKICSPGHPDRSLALNNLGSDLWARFIHTGNVEDLEHGIDMHRECLEIRPRGHPDRWSALNSLALDLWARFNHQGDVEDLDRAIVMHQECLEFRPPGHPDRSTALCNLGSDLSTRFSHKGDVEDLERAIEMHYECLELCPPGHPDRSRALNDLGSDLWARFSHKGDIEDLERAIEAHHECLGLRPLGHPHRSTTLNSLGSDLWARFNHTHDVEDLERAIELHYECLALRPSGHPHRSTTLNNLGSDLATRFNHNGDVRDMERAIELYRECVQLSPPSHPQHSSISATLESWLRRRSELMRQNEVPVVGE